MMSREKQIELIRERIRAPIELDFPTEDMIRILSKEVIDDIEEEIYDAEYKALEWVLREVFEVTP